MQFPGFLNRFETVCDFADDFQFRVFLQHRTDETTPGLVVIYYENSDG